MIAACGAGGGAGRGPASGLARRRSASGRERWTPICDWRGTSGGGGEVRRHGEEAGGRGLSGRGGRGSSYCHSAGVGRSFSAIEVRRTSLVGVPFVGVHLLAWSWFCLWVAPELPAAAALSRLPKVCCRDVKHSSFFRRPPGLDCPLLSLCIFRLLARSKSRWGPLVSMSPVARGHTHAKKRRIYFLADIKTNCDAASVLSTQRPPPYRHLTEPEAPSLSARNSTRSARTHTSTVTPGDHSTTPSPLADAK